MFVLFKLVEKETRHYLNHYSSGQLQIAQKILEHEEILALWDHIASQSIQSPDLSLERFEELMGHYQSFSFAK